MVCSFRVCGVLLVCALCVAAGPAEAADAVLSETAAATTLDRAALRDIAYDISREYGVNPRLIDSVIRVESDYNPRALSHKGAQGLMQLMPATAAMYGVVDPFDPEQNIRGGVREVARLLKVYSGNLTLVLAAYNAGQGAVTRYRGVPPYRETRNYVRKVMTLYTGRAWSPKKTPRRPDVRIMTDPDTGQAIITNHTPGTTKAVVVARRSTPSGPLSGGFGR